MNTKAINTASAQPVTPVHYDVPAGACDCHVHIHVPDKFPYDAGRFYTPEAAPPEELARLHKELHIDRVVIVQPTVYGTDHSVAMYAMEKLGKQKTRGVAVINDKTTEKDLDALEAAGFKGIRLNLITSGVNDPAVVAKRFEDAVNRLKPRKNWHVDINISLAVLTALKEQLAASPVPLVIDHFCQLNEALGVDQPGFADLVELLKKGNTYIKISISGGPRKDYTLFTPIAKALIAANADRVIWATNWPHPDTKTPPDKKATDITPVFKVDDGNVFNMLPVWEPNAAIRKKILVDNPARLFQF